MKHMLKFIGEKWKDLPEGERKIISDFQRLEHHIRQREKRIERMGETLKKIKLELREWKKQKTTKYNELTKYHKEFTPTFSTSLSKNKKVNRNEKSMSFKTRGNLSWTTVVRLKGKGKPVYIGTIKYVNEMLDKIEGKSEYFELRPEINPRHENLIKSKIEGLIVPLIRMELVELLNSTGSIDSFIEEKINGSKYWEKLYNKSPFFELKVESKKKESKGFFIGFVDGKPIYRKKKSEE